MAAHPEQDREEPKQPYTRLEIEVQLDPDEQVPADDRRTHICPLMNE